MSSPDYIIDQFLPSARAGLVQAKQMVDAADPAEDNTMIHENLVICENAVSGLEDAKAKQSKGGDLYNRLQLIYVTPMKKYMGDMSDYDEAMLFAGMVDDYKVLFDLSYAKDALSSNPHGGDKLRFFYYVREAFARAKAEAALIANGQLLDKEPLTQYYIDHKYEMANLAVGIRSFAKVAEPSILERMKSIPTNVINQGGEGVKVGIRRIHPDAKLPVKTDEAIGWAVYASVDVFINPGESARIPTGLGVQIGKSHYVRTATHPLVYVKGPVDVITTLIDATFEGELTVLLVNLGQELLSFKSGECVGQFFVQAAVASELEEVKVVTQ